VCKLRITTLPEKFQEQQNQLLRICCALLVLTTGGLLTDIGTVLAPESVKPGGVLFSAFFHYWYYFTYYLGFLNSLIWGCTRRVYAFAFMRTGQGHAPSVSLDRLSDPMLRPSSMSESFHLGSNNCASATVICVTLTLCEVRRELWGNGLASQTAWAWASAADT
jgi:hypothetical protein